MKKLKQIKWVQLCYYVLMPVAIAFIISMLLPEYKEFYNSLDKIIDVPQVVFPIVWTILYILMGISAYLIDGKENSKKALDFYYVQLFFNLSWTIVFFGFKLITLGMIWLIIILILAIITMVLFYRINKTSAYLFIPYIVWLCFALVLNVSIVVLN